MDKLKDALRHFAHKFRPARIKKALGSFFGGLTGAGVAAIAQEYFGVELSELEATTIAGLGAIIATYFFPKNEEDAPGTATGATDPRLLP